MAVTPHAKGLRRPRRPRRGRARATAAAPRGATAFARALSVPALRRRRRPSSPTRASRRSRSSRRRTAISSSSRRAAAAGKHVLLEKPLDVTTARAVELVETCERAGVTLGVVLQHRFRPAGERLARSPARRRPRRPRRLLDRHPPLAAAELLRRARPRHAGARRRRRAALAGHPHARSHAEPRRPGRRGARLRRRPRPCTGWRPRTSSARRRASRTARIGAIEATTAAFPGAAERIELIGTKGTASLVGTALDVRLHGRRARSASSRTAAPAARAPTRWPSRTTTIAP